MEHLSILLLFYGVSFLCRVSMLFILSHMEDIYSACLLNFLYLHQSQKRPRSYCNKTPKPESSDKHWVLFFLFYCFQKNLLKARHLSITQLKDSSAAVQPFLCHHSREFQ